jgi:hypothetical protein
MADAQVIRHRQLDEEDELDADYPDEYHMLGEAPVQLDKSFASAIIVDNLPVVGKEKFDKLLGVVTKIYSQIPGGAIVEVFMPTDEKGQTKGYAFVEFSTVEAARNAVQQTNGYKLDRAHIFRVNFFEDFQVYDKVTDAFQPIEMGAYKPKVLCCPHYYLLRHKRHFRHSLVRSRDLQARAWMGGTCRKTCGGGLLRSRDKLAISTRCATRT